MNADERRKKSFGTWPEGDQTAALNSQPPVIGFALPGGERRKRGYGRISRFL